MVQTLARKFKEIIKDILQIENFFLKKVMLFIFQINGISCYIFMQSTRIKIGIGFI